MRFPRVSVLRFSVEAFSVAPRPTPIPALNTIARPHAVVPRSATPVQIARQNIAALLAETARERL